MKKLVTTLLSILILGQVLVPSSYADMFDTYGFDPKGMAMTGAVCALADTAAAAYYNPAGLGKVKNSSFGISYMFSAPSMDVMEAAGPVEGIPDDDELSLGAFTLAMAMDLTQMARLNRQVTFGLGLSIMDDMSIITLEDVEESRHRFIRYGCPLKRLNIYLGTGVEAVSKKLWIGGGAHIMVTGEGALNLEADVGDLSTTENITPSQQDIWMNMNAALNPTFGVIWQPMENINIGFSYKDDIYVSFDPFSANIDLLIGDHAAAISAGAEISCYYHPTTLRSGISYQIGALAVEVGITCEKWSQFSRGNTRDARKESPDFQDTFNYGCGVDYDISDVNRFKLSDVAIYGGYQYAPSPVPDQPGNSNYLDTDRHILGLGAGFSFKDPFGIIIHPITIGTAIQDQILMKRTVHKEAVPDYTIQGKVLSGMISVNVRM